MYICWNEKLFAECNGWVIQNTVAQTQISAHSYEY